MKHTATFRFYAELNDLLPISARQRDLPYDFRGHPSVKDAIESLGVPHTEVELIVVNGTSVDFVYRMQDGDRVAVYPMIESLDITPIIRLRDKPLRDTRFVVDVHLGTLARRLRLLGFDTLYRNDYRDPEIIAIAMRERRIVLTRDRGILRNRCVTHGYLVRSTNPTEQLREVLERFDLREQLSPFTRCLRCNGGISPVARERIEHLLEPLTKGHHDEFYRCSDCGHVYWKGSHYQRLLAVVADSGIPPEEGSPHESNGS